MTGNRMAPLEPSDCQHARKWEVVGAGRMAGQQNEQGKIILPSIRKTFPELDRPARPDLRPESQRDRAPTTPPSSTSPTGVQFPGPLTPPDYTISPDRSKRRRTSSLEEQGFGKMTMVPRSYVGAHRVLSQPESPTVEGHPAFRPSENSGPSSPYHSHYSNSLLTRSPDTIGPHERVHAHTPLVLRLSNIEPRVENSHMHRHTREGEIPEPTGRPSFAPSNGYSVEMDEHGYRPPNYSYGYHHPNRAHSLSVGSAHIERTPVFLDTYRHNSQEPYMRMNNYGLGIHGNGKQRKRRGNLPKETTEKLRAWFHTHLGHPYPTEEEKQMLMRHTGLQMNQISNWFINARRRHLPGIMENAQAETKARNGLSVSVDRNGLSSTKRRDHDHDTSDESGDAGPEPRSAKRK